MVKSSLEYHSVINPEFLDGKSIHKDNFKEILKTDVFKESKVKGYAYYGYYLGKIVYCINENDPTWTKNTVYNWMGIE